jgi:cell wall-associated NlpC family hydrolase
MTADLFRNDLVVREAREWIGTPFRDQASAKGKGCDCKGLVWGVARELGFPEADSFYAQFVRYDLGPGGSVPHQLFLEGMEQLFDRADEPAPGDILLLAYKRKPLHMAICCGDTAVHAQIGPKNWVKETRMGVLLHPKLYSLHSVWRWRYG